MNYLDDEQHYMDRYDLHTIEECLDTVKMFQEVYQKSLKSEEIKDISQEDKLHDVNLMLHRTLFVMLRCILISQNISTLPTIVR